MLLEVFLLGVGLSMDALAVSLALGAAERKKFTWKKILLTAGLFGLFQAAMPLIGWGGGTLCGELVRQYGRMVASLLLFWIGGKMIWDRNKTETPRSDFWKLIVLAFATSIDALLVGVGFACLNRQGVPFDSALIGITTFTISAAGCVTGRLFGNLLGNKCAILGGLVLVGIGVKILFFG